MPRCILVFVRSDIFYSTDVAENTHRILRCAFHHCEASAAHCCSVFQSHQLSRIHGCPGVRSSDRIPRRWAIRINVVQLLIGSLHTLALKEVQVLKPAYEGGKDSWWSEVIRRTALKAGADANGTD